MLVSVVVPVFNPGRYIDDLVGSLRRQTMPRSDFEVVFVDDGSTDGTADRLEALAAVEPNVRVIHIPPSGWPGRPRNVGIDAAQGEYIQFVDHDDELTDEALERMYAYAVANGSDVVVGKEGRRSKTWRTGPLFARNRPRATLQDDPALLLLLTPHKMFRTAFLRERGIRFLEGRRRLEDHAFVMTTYFEADVISVLADYTCYVWHLRRGSAGRAPKNWTEYYTSLRDTLDVVEQHTEPGPFRDRLLAHWYLSKGLRRLGPGFAEIPTAEARRLFEQLRQLTLERFPAHLDARVELGPRRVRAALLRAGAFDKARAWSRAESRLRLVEHVDHLTLGRDGMALTLTATLEHGRATLRLEEVGGRLYLVPPVPLDGLVPRAALDVTETYERLTLKVYARHRSSDQRFVLPGGSSRLPGRDGHHRLGARASVSLDPVRAEEGRPLRPGSWWLQAELRMGGWMVTCPVRSRRLRVGFPDQRVTVTSTGRGVWYERLQRPARAARRLRARLPS